MAGMGRLLVWGKRLQRRSGGPTVVFPPSRTLPCDSSSPVLQGVGWDLGSKITPAHP